MSGAGDVAQGPQVATPGTRERILADIAAGQERDRSLGADIARLWGAVERLEQRLWYMAIGGGAAAGGAGAVAAKLLETLS